ncbi:hypothetical protein Poli38472_000045 [Pythium oligandrum]|uniref:Diphthamide biosynthesis protein 3 n=1 Tax=Pythium oligandrum TaxID=41045 RepID=A0A8K1CBL4_PYTOL|nr:hypothetical protein Poli38472_000045 [Pythium oligandrum]|eukprot:TMW60003.1 hypothetical protein Poli38472_000045 [Pythium oligandrum]
MAITHYEALQVARDCSGDDIRRAYHRAARQHHPDKQNGFVKAPDEVENQEFLRVQAAYEVLRDPVARAEYDRQLTQDELRHHRDTGDALIVDEVPLNEMQREELRDSDAEEDEDAEVLYTYLCRCGDAYEVAEQELVDGVDIIPCNGCSLKIRVIHELS